MMKVSIVSVVILEIVLSSAVAAPPLTDMPNKPEGGVKDDKRPTTKEEFAALAKVGPKPPWLPFRGQDQVEVDIIDGTVVAVSRKGIEIQLKGMKDTVKYPPHTLLDSGAVCHWESDSHCYLLDDVAKGDVVILGVGTVDKEKGTECFYLSIRERPGSVIPPSRKPSYPKPYHVSQQVEIEAAREGRPDPTDKKPDMPKKKPEPPVGSGAASLKK